MNDRELEARLRAWYRSEVSETEAAPLALRLDVASIPRTATPTARRFGRGRGMTLLAAAAAVVLVGGALAAGSGVLRQQGIVPPVTAPSLAAVAISSPTAPSTPFPTPTAAPIVWTQASLGEDWPAQVRPEPAAGSGAAPMPPTYIDPSGDAGSDATSYVDIRDVTANPSGVSFDLMSKPPDVDPSQAWIAYGLVVDTNGDGVADFRYGIDNLPSSVGQDLHRAWRTDLHKGRTEFDPKPEGNGGGGRDDFSQVGATQFGTGYPAGAIGTGPRWNFYASFDTPSGEGHDGAKQDKPFYVWASAIVGGQVVATDYAPDTGWLTPNRNGANPGGTYVVQLDPAAVAKGVLPDLSTRISLVVPRGWAANGASVNGPGGALEFRRPEHLGACDTSGNAITPIGPTVDDLVTFLAHQRGVTTSANSAVTVDGYGGTYLEYTVAADPIGDIPDPLADCGSCCASGEFHQVWILDIDGVRLVIDASAAKASDTVKAAFQQIVDSVAFEPVAAPTPTPTPAPTPTPTPTPVPTPTPTPFPAAAGPVPHGARSWEVTVENRKSKPATLFLAEAPFNDLSDLCGSVTPNVVPAGVTEKVTFQMPPTGQTECWLMVEPGPGADGAFGPTDGWPIPGPRRLIIGAPGENGPDSATLWEGP